MAKIDKKQWENFLLIGTDSYRVFFDGKYYLLIDDVNT
jgi:hypothetical protein